jgi:hypothetical protein
MSNELRYNLTERAVIEGSVALFGTLDVGRRNVRSVRAVGWVCVVGAAGSWFLVPDRTLGALLALCLAVFGLCFVAVAKPYVDWWYQRRLTKLAKRDGLGSTVGEHIAVIKDNGLQEDSTGKSVFVAWGQFARALETDRVHVLVLEGLSCFVIPKDPDRAATSAFIAEIRKRTAIGEDNSSP